MLKQCARVNYQGANCQLRNKKLSILMALVIMFTVIIPVGAAFAAEDNVSILSSYKYVNAGDDTAAGIIRVKEDGMLEGTNNIVIQLSLPEGIGLSDYSAAEDSYEDWVSFRDSTAGSVYVDGSSSGYFEFRLNGINGVGEDAELAQFDFSKNVSRLDISGDFTGNLDVVVDVIGLAKDAKGQESILWTDNKDVTIAKVANFDVAIIASTLKEVSVGEHKKVAKITVEESSAYSIKEGAIVNLIIETDDVEFNSVTATGEDGIIVSPVTLKKVDGKKIKAEVTVIDESATFPGTITFDPIYLDISLNEKKDIRITVKVSDPAEDETVTVASVGDAKAKIENLENNDTVALHGQTTTLDALMQIGTKGTAFKAGDIMTFRLNKGELAADPNVNTNKITVKRYDYNKAFFVSFDEDVTNFTLGNLKIALGNDVEPWDITLTISGDYGEVGDVVIGVAVVPIVVKSTDPSDGAMDINNNSTIQVSFNQRIFAGNDFSHIEVKDSNNNAVNAIVFIENKKLIISPVNNLSYSMTYTVNIPTAAINDLVGNTLTNDIKYTFTTKPDSNAGGGSAGGGGGSVASKKDSAIDISDKVNALLEDSSRGDTITVDSDDNGLQVINNEILRNVSDIGCSLSMNLYDTRANLTFESEALLTNELKEAGEDALVEISASTIEVDDAQDAANYAISVGGKILCAYNFNITVKKDEEVDGTEIHTLNGNANVILDLSDTDFDGINTELLTVIHQQPNGTWLEVESVFDSETKTLSFTTNSFSLFAVIEGVVMNGKMIELTIGQIEACVDGNLYTMDMEPYVNSMTGRTFIPMRFVSEALGAKVDWFAETNIIVIKDGSKEITLTIGSKDVLVNNDVIVIDCAPEIYPPGRVFVPLRFISETLDAKVSYESNSKELTITK